MALAALVAAPGLAEGPGAAVAPPSILVVGVRNDAGDEKAWKDRRLGMGIRGRLVQRFSESGAFTLLEERRLAPTVREAVGGYWLSPRDGDPRADLAGLRATTGAAWIAYGAVTDVGVTRDQVRGLVGGRRWRYRVEVTLCLDGAGVPELCAEGEGTSVTSFAGFVFEYRGDDVAFDQAGPAEAVDKALAAAFDGLMPRWAALAPPSAPPPAAVPAMPAAIEAELAVYVAAFGLDPTVAERWPDLGGAQVGLGVAQRIADALYESGRFRFFEEKAEVAARLGELLERRASGAEGDAARVPESHASVPWILYGEVTDVQVARHERVTGFVGKTEIETRATVQLRLLERSTGRFYPATETGVDTRPLRDWDRELDPAAVADATGEAVRQAAAALLAGLGGGG